MATNYHFQLKFPLVYNQCQSKHVSQIRNHIASLICLQGLKANVLVPFEEGQMKKPADIVNEDSSNRKRSSSLTEQVCLSIFC